MRSVVVAASLLAVCWAAAPADARAQEPEPAPMQQAPEVAVPRVQEGTTRVAAPAAAAAAETRVAPAADQSGSERRRPPAASSRRDPGSSQDATERGSARRPPAQQPRVAVDRAVPRTRARVSQPVVIVRDPWRYYDPWGHGAFGLGYFYYSPAWGYPGYGYPAPYVRGYETGRVRLQVTPKDAEVYVDGYYAGIVDDFDGRFQGLRLDAGAYRIEVRKDGYQPLSFDVRVQHRRTITFRGELEPVP